MTKSTLYISCTFYTCYNVIPHFANFHYHISQQIQKLYNFTQIMKNINKRQKVCVIYRGLQDKRQFLLS